jgi:exodeoxyribonuclease VII small subunit
MKNDANQSPEPIKEESFEAGLERLAKLVAALESQELTLDDSIKAFEDGVALTQRLSEKLSVAEARLEILTKGPDGLPSARPFSLAAEGQPAGSQEEEDEGEEDD